MAKIVYYRSDAEDLRPFAEALEGTSHSIWSADCVLSAIELCKSETPDLVILTERSGPLDAVDFLKIKQSHEELEDLACLILSRGTIRRMTYFEHGCDSFIELPVSVEEFMLRIDAILKRSPKSTAAETSGGLSGSFEHASLVDVLQMLVAAGKNGVCNISTPTRKGTFYFKGGQVIHAVADDEEGEDAFLTILRASQQEGGFAFQSEELADIPTTIEKRTDHLLLGLASILDEESM